MLKRLIAQAAVLGVGALALIGLGGVSSLLSGREQPVVLSAADSASALATMQDQLAVTRKELERAHQILDFSGRYGIPADLSASIYDHAVAEGIAPAIGFQLVHHESRFRPSAQSHMAAIGLTQLRLATARAYDPTLEVSDLMNQDVSLRIGFRYLKDLLKRFDQDVALALEAYNKGPTLVAAQQELGWDVKGKYSEAVMKKKS